MEMNIHLAQSIQSRNELKRIANVQYQIVGVKDSSPIIGCQQDTLSGAYMLTDPNVKVKGWEIANILCNTTSETKFDIEMDKEYTGHEIFSHIIPVGINNTNKLIKIVNGKLISGNLDKSALSFAKNSIIHFIWDKFGPNKTRRFIDDSQRLILNYLMIRGQTVGFKDIIVDDKINDQIRQMIDNKILESKYLITQFENDIDQLSANTIENAIADSISDVKDNIGQLLMTHLKIDNFFWAAAKSGAKGTISNVAQVSGIIGQNNVEGARFRKKVEGRALVYWHRDDDTPEARGFINNSYLSGLRGYEFFYNAAAGREGLIDTAIKSVTWETPIIIIDNGKPKYTEIGKWIDNLLDNNSEKVEHMKEQNMELMELENKVLIPTTDYNGNVSWGHISAITRHDPGNQLYRIKTEGGRIVTVTESKSLLIWKPELNEFREVLTPEISLGDFVPVTAELSEPPIISKYLRINNNNIELNSENGYLFGKHFSGDFINDSFYNLNINEFPPEFYNSSNEFISSFLRGYCHNNVSIFFNSIYISCNNEKIGNGILMMCSRLNIVGKIAQVGDQYRLVISKNYALQLSKHINVFIDDNVVSDDRTLNNIVFDKIIGIDLVDVKEHPKVYDLTIPETFNFGLANGLQVRDTAQTGYIQRQMIKALEDLSIKYDGTNRNSRGTIIQMVYGENGFSQSTQTELILNILSMDNKTLSEKLTFSSEQIKKLEKGLKMSSKELNEFNSKHLEKLKKMRDEAREIQLKSLMNYKILEEKFISPVNLFRITQDFSNKKELIELKPQDIEKSIEDFLTDYETRLISSLKPTDKYMTKDDRSLKFLLEVALNEYLAPVKCIFEYGLTKKQFDMMLKDIKMSFIKAIIEPGEMVGILAGQSIGEPTSQINTM
jgi:hypothetical protein